MNPAPPPAMPFLVDPSAMLTLVLDAPGGPRIVNAITCRYVPATVQVVPPHRVVAVEVIHDAYNPNPMYAYCCNAYALMRELFTPGALRHVSPYVLPVLPPAEPVPNAFP